MATSFQDRIRSTLKKVTTGGAQAPGTPFDDVLGQFVDTLTAEERYVGAAIEKGYQPAMRSFVTWPRYRRDERSIMLTFWWDGTTMKVLNEATRAPFKTPDELSEYLLDFLQNSAFPSTLAEYERRCGESVDGFLRIANLIDAGPEDVMVEVFPTDQRQLAEAKPGAIMNLNVAVEAVPGTAEYRDTEGYRFLNSAGFGLRLTTHRLAGGKIHLSGEVMAPDATE